MKSKEFYNIYKSIFEENKLNLENRFEIMFPSGINYHNVVNFINIYKKYNNFDLFYNDLVKTRNVNKLEGVKLIKDAGLVKGLKEAKDLYDNWINVYDVEEVYKLSKDKFKILIEYDDIVSYIKHHIKPEKGDGDFDRVLYFVENLIETCAKQIKPDLKLFKYESLNYLIFTNVPNIYINTFIQFLKESDINTDFYILNLNTEL